MQRNQYSVFEFVAATVLWCPTRKTICIILTTSFRTVFGRARLVTEVTCWFLHVLVSACITDAPTERMSVKFDIGDFMKVFRDSQSWLKSDESIGTSREDQSTFRCCR